MISRYFPCVCVAVESTWFKMLKCASFVRISEAVDCFVDDAEEVAIAGEHLGMKMISIEPH